MFFVIVGVALIIMNVTGFGPVGHWTWDISGDLWKFLLPFLLALAWWGWADASGMTRRREIERDTERKKERRLRNIAAMGLGPKDSRYPPGRHR